MAEPSPLTGRKAELLHSIVREYIETGEPVASRTIARRRRGKHALSAATIRNVMADLADEGFLMQPHTSAGRVPTEKAFQVFVRDLCVKLRPTDLEKVNAGFSGVESLEDGIERSSRVLMDLTHNVGIAAAIPANSQTLEQIELVPLPDRRVLVVVVTRDHMVRDKVVTLDEALAPEDLVSIRNYINRNFGGWVLSEARQELARRLQAEAAYYDSLLQQVRRLYARGMLDVEFDPEIHMEGTSYLMAVDLRLTREKMRELLRALEEKKRILQLLDRFLEQPAGEVHVQVGLGEMHSAMRDLSLIGIKIAPPGGMAVKLAVLGPMRMHYERVMAAVLSVGRTLEQLPA